MTQTPSGMLPIFGPNGLAAWIGVIYLAKPQPGETVVISGAAGATGSVAGQMAKIMGAQDIGIRGSDAKCAWLRDDLGFRRRSQLQIYGFRPGLYVSDRCTH